MTLDPLAIATKGYVCNAALTRSGCPDDISIATKGYICVPVPITGGGDSSKGAKKNVLDTSLDALLTREDEEIFAIVTALSRRKH